MCNKWTRNLVFVAMLAALVAPVQAAFLVEAHSSGLANGNFSLGGDTTSVSASIPSVAYGLTATSSVFGGNGSAFGDTYIYSYTPGTDADNLPIPAGTDLGNGDLASGLVGGGDGLYNVYITWPETTNANAAGSKITVTSDGADIVLDPVNNNTGGTGDPGASSAWLLIGADVTLTAGNTYTVSQVANYNSYVSQRSHGVMWEAVPEPFSVSLLGIGALALLRRRKG